MTTPLHTLLTNAANALQEGINELVQSHTDPTTGLLDCPEVTLKVEAEQDLVNQLRAAAEQSQAAPAIPNRPDLPYGWNNLTEYILQDDLHNRLTPRVVDIAYSAFMSGRTGKNKDDGGPCDWFNDTKPMVMEALAKIRKDLAEAAHGITASAQPAAQLPDDQVEAAQRLIDADMAKRLEGGEA